MNIKYKNGKDGLTIGVADYKNAQIVPGYNVMLVLAVAEMCTSEEKKQLFNDERLVSYAKPRGTDEYNEEIGREIVKNKLIIKDAERQILKISIMEKYLRMILGKVESNSAKYVRRMDNAYERLGSFE